MTLLTQDTAQLPTTPASPPWGIYLNGSQVVAADNVVEVVYQKEYTLSDYPVEEGAFETYDKVELPYTATVRFSTGGSLQDRQNFLSSIDAIIGNTTVYDVVTPEKTYISANLQKQSYKRTSSNGVGLIAVDIDLLQVRVTATAQFSNTGAPNTPITNASTPSGQDPINQGGVQTQQANAQQQGGFYNPNLGGE